MATDSDGEAPAEVRVTDRRRFTETGDERSPGAGPADPGPVAPPAQAQAPPAPMPEPHAMPAERAETFGIEAVFAIFYQSAMIALGAPDPQGGAKAVNLAEAEQAIGLMRLLKEKTARNLTPDEERAAAGFLHDAQMAYVAVARGVAGSRP